MHLSNWQTWSWLAGFLGYATLMTVLIVRRRFRTFPWFTFLLAQEIIQTMVLFETHHLARPRTYYYTYWIFEIFDSLVRVAVFFELARITSRLLREVNGRERIRGLMSAVLVAFVLCVLVIVNGRGTGNLVVTSALKISVCTSIFGGVLVLFFVLTTFLEGIRIRIHSQALAYGLFVYFTGKLVAQSALLFDGKWLWFKLQNFMGPLYILCLFAWSIMLWFDEPKRVLTEEMDRLHRTFAEIEKMHGSTQIPVGTSLTDVLGL